MADHYPFFPLEIDRVKIFSKKTWFEWYLNICFVFNLIQFDKIRFFFKKSNKFKKHTPIKKNIKIITINIICKTNK